MIKRTLANFCEQGCGGWGGIRTHETLSRLPVFKTGAFNRSATSPFLFRRKGVIAGSEVGVQRGVYENSVPHGGRATGEGGLK